MRIDLHGLTLVFIVGAWLAGIVCASFIALPPFMPLLVAALAFSSLLLLWQHPLGRVLALMTAFLFLGAFRYLQAQPLNTPHSISPLIGAGTVQLQGNVSEEPTIQGRERVLIIAVQAMRFNTAASWQNATGTLAVSTLGTNIEDPYGANYGDTVTVQGVLRPPTPYDAPGVFASMFFPRLSVVTTAGSPISILTGQLYHVRVMMATIIQQALPQPAAALFIALFLSLRTPALSSLRPLFNVTGTAHLIAPSGFKVTILAGMVQGIIGRFSKSTRDYTKRKPLRVQRDWRYWLSMLLTIMSIASYTLLSGAGPAALRAGIMGILLVSAPKVGRTYNVYTAMALAAALLSGFDPFILWDVGFLLSFLGTLGILLLTPTFQRLLHPLARLPFGLIIAETVAVTLAAQVATLPIFAIAFNQISFVAPLANILTVPLLGTFLVLALLLCCAGLLFAPFATLIGWVAWPFLWYLIQVVTWCAALPGAYITIQGFSGILGWSYYGLVALIILVLVRTQLFVSASSLPTHTTAPLPPHFWFISQISVAALLLLSTGIIAHASTPDTHVQVIFLSVAPSGQSAQGEAILIRTPDGRNALIDGGLDPTSLALLLDKQLPIWQRTLDLVILTVPLADHLTGLQGAVTHYHIGEVVDAGMAHPNAGYALWRRTLREQTVLYTQALQGMTIRLGTMVALQIFWPGNQLDTGSDLRTNTLVMRLLAPGLSILLLGAAAESTHALKGVLTTIASNYLRAAIVHIVGEIGKPFSAQAIATIQMAQPSLLLITPPALSAKQRKIAGFSTILPETALAPLLTNRDMQIMQTAETGSLEISSDSNGWSVQSV